MKRETWLYVKPERSDGKFAMPVHDHAERTAGMLIELLDCAAPDQFGETRTWWYGTRGGS